MVITKSKEEIEKMYRAGQVAAQLLYELGDMAKPGLQTYELDKYANTRLKELKVISPFKGYRGYPCNICVSVNEQVVHGIPSTRVLNEGDIVSIDCGVMCNGYVGDVAATFPVGVISSKAQKLISDAKESLYRGIGQMWPNRRLYDISYSIQSYIEPLGYGIVREFCGHGVGRRMHEDPQVPNYGRQNTGQRLREGWVLAVEPMVNSGGANIRVEEDGWTVVTLDGQISAHFEHTIAITQNGPFILTELS